MSGLWSRFADYIRETDKVLFSICIFTSFYGAAIILSATRFTGSARSFTVQLAGILLGIIAAVFISRVTSYDRFVRLWPVFAVVAVGLVGLTFLIGYAPEGTDDKAWIKLPGGMSFQPSELLKIAFTITFARHVSAIEGKESSLKNVLLLCLHGAVPILLIHIQGDDGTALVLAIMFVVMMFAAGIKLRYFMIALAAAAAAAPIVWVGVLSDDQKDRFLILFNPEADLYGKGWQQWRARTAMANGGFWGQGYMKGDFVQGNKLPKGYNDFIFASAGEELGMFGLITIMVLLLAICIRILIVAHRAKNKAGKIICCGIFAMIAAQSILNIGMCVSLLPVIGITLPFFSAGGTSVVATFLGIGLVINVYMHRANRVMYLNDDN